MGNCVFAQVCSSCIINCNVKVPKEIIGEALVQFLWTVDKDLQLWMPFICSEFVVHLAYNDLTWLA